MNGRHFTPCILLLVLTGCASTPAPPLPDAAAVPPHSEDGDASVAGSAEDGGFVDTTRRKVRGFAHWLGEEVNDWFGDKPFSDGGKVSHGRLSMRVRWQEDEGSSTSVRFRARFSLPNLKDKAYVFFGQENERELISDQPEAFTREQQLLSESRRTDQTGFLGLGFNLRDYVDLRVGVRGGIKPYAQARYRREWMLSASNRAELRETVFWRASDGFGSTTSINLEHAYSPFLSLKWQNAATITKETDGFAWSSSVGLFRAFGDTRLLSVEALASGETGSDTDVGEYGIRLKWQRPVYRDWLLAELILGHFWPRNDDEPERKRSWAAGAGLEMRF
nr:hypothetical protein [Thauera linaloolentis]